MIAATDTLLGTVVDGRFEIRDKLGQGGMGAVYRAWQRSTEREIAIKLIAKSHASEPMAVERFLREARLASSLSHPNTISVYDFGKLADGRLFIAMELLRGQTLGRLLKSQGALAIDRVIRIAIQICDALAAAHALKIVHRDLKPDNVMVIDGTADLVKVLDFGLAKRLDDRSVAGTAAGVVVGTPRYIAPESVMSGASYPEGDMYALGVMIAEMALGRPIWNGTLAEILRFQVKPAEHIRDVRDPLHIIVKSLLDPTPAMRPTAVQLREQLVGLQSGVMQRHRPPTPAPPTTLPSTPMTIAARPRSASKQPARASTPVTIAARPRTPSGRTSPVDTRVDAPAPQRRGWILPAIVGTVIGVAGIVVAVAYSSSSAPPPTQPATTAGSAATEPNAHGDPWVSDPWQHTTQGADAAIAAPSAPLPSPGAAIAPAATTPPPTQPLTNVERAMSATKPAAPPDAGPVDAARLLEPAECMAIRDNAQKQSCLSMYCAQDPGHPFCEMHFDTDPSDPALKPMPAVPPPGKTSQKQPAAKTKTTPAKPAKAKSAKPCDSCLELPDSTVDPFGRR